MIPLLVKVDVERELRVIPDKAYITFTYTVPKHNNNTAVRIAELNGLYRDIAFLLDKYISTTYAVIQASERQQLFADYKYAAESTSTEITEDTVTYTIKTPFLVSIGTVGTDFGTVCKHFGEAWDAYCAFVKAYNGYVEEAKVYKADIGLEFYVTQPRYKLYTDALFVESVEYAKRKVLADMRLLKRKGVPLSADIDISNLYLSGWKDGIKEGYHNAPQILLMTYSCKDIATSPIKLCVLKMPVRYEFEWELVEGILF